VQKLYQRMLQWARSSTASSTSDVRTVHTEVTVERQNVTVLMGRGAAAGLDRCPLCGKKLAPAESEQIQARLQEGSPLQQRPPAAGA
jgi:uncharacterized protein with PIN domain